MALPPALPGITTEIGKLPGQENQRSTSSRAEIGAIHNTGGLQEALPRIPVRHHNRTLHALLDSAATHNFIRTSCLPPETTITPTVESIQLATADTTCRVQGEASIEITTGQETSSSTYYVVPSLREELILGRPWLKEQHACLDFEAGRILYGTKKRHIQFWEQKPSTLSQEIIMPPEIDTVPSDYQQPLCKLINTYKTVFQEATPPTQTNATEHHIQLTDKKPVTCKPYRYSSEKLKIIEHEIKIMKEKGFVEPADTPYNSPIVVVPKKDGTSRLCIDYRKLNSITVAETPPQIRLQDALKNIGQARIFTTLDLRMGYWQVPMHPASRPYTAFTTPRGEKLQFKVMPFGLTNAPSRFQTMINTVLSGYLDEFCSAYLDDIIVYSNTWTDHLLHLSKVLERLEIYRLACAMPKCQFGRTQLDYLGHIISPDGNMPQPKSVDAITSAEPPTNRKQLKAFLGIVGWLREFIPRAAEISAPLTDLLGNQRPWKWTSAAAEAFRILKEQAHNIQPLHRPDATLPFILQTDASKVGLGAVLYQQKGNQKQVIAYASAKLNPVEQRYHINEQECLSVIWGIKRYRHLLEDRPFTLRTDSKALTWLNTMKDSRAKLTRWALMLQEYKFTIEHCPGKENQLPDALSRHPEAETVGADCHDLDRLTLPTTGHAPSEPPTLQQVELSSELTTFLRTSQQNDPDTRAKKERWEAGQQTPPEHRNTSDEGFMQHHRWAHGLLWHRRDAKQCEWRVLVPPDARERLLFKYHDDDLAGHPGAEETTTAIGRFFTWPRMRQAVSRHVARCMLCACTKSYTHLRPADQRPRHPAAPWETVCLDLMGPYPRTSRRNRFLLVITDLFSRWIEAYPLPAADAGHITRLLEREIFPRWGYPRALLTDNGRQFTGKVWIDACTKWEITPWTTPVYHPRANPTERRNQEIKKALRLRLRENHRDWENQLPSILFSLRNRRNRSTGYAPSEILFGQLLHRPNEWTLKLPALTPWDTTLQQRARARETRQQRVLHPPHPATAPAPLKYQIGDRVLIRNHVLSNKAANFHSGFAPKWKGPYTVTHRSGPVYWVADADERRKIHQDEMRPAPETTTSNEDHRPEHLDREASSSST